jgi:hypothetical protein
VTNLQSVIINAQGGSSTGCSCSQTNFPPDYNVTPYSTYYNTGVGVGNIATTSTTGGNGEVVIFY